MAYYRKRSNGWEYRISYKAPDGSYKQKTKSGYRTKGDAQRAAAQAELDLLDNVIEDKQITLADYFQQWAVIHKKPHVSKGTFVKYDMVHQMIIEFYKETKLANITPTMHQQVLNQMSDRYVKYTITQFNASIKRAVAYAIHEGKIKRDFTALARIHSSKPSKAKELKYLELDEYRALMARASRRTDDQCYFFVYLVGRTGLRFSEANGLTLESLNRSDQTLKVERTYHHYGADKGWQTTKNKQSQRLVPVDSQLIRLWDDYLLRGYVDNPDSRLFIKTYNHNVNNLLRRELDKPFSIHGLRHTYVSYLIYHNIDINTIASVLGHKDSTETIRTYTHLLQAKKEQDFDIIRGLFNKFGASKGQDK